jgi:L,D-peptidoglycan transpeptidase YkuD (ErfK/YbiS/YcfS/YnhG family)
MRLKRSQTIVLRRAPGKRSLGLLLLPYGAKRVALGRSGIAALKREGDGSTPLGRFPIRQVLVPRRSRGPPTHAAAGPRHPRR